MTYSCFTYEDKEYEDGDGDNICMRMTNHDGDNGHDFDDVDSGNGHGDDEA